MGWDGQNRTDKTGHRTKANEQNYDGNDAVELSTSVNFKAMTCKREKRFFIFFEMKGK